MSQVASARGLTRFLAARQLRSDRFGTIAAILGVALGVATVNAVVVLDESTSRVEAGNWETNRTRFVSGFAPSANSAPAPPTPPKRSAAVCRRSPT